MMGYETELTIAGFEVDVTIKYSLDDCTKGYDDNYKSFNVESVVIPTYDEWIKNPDNNSEDYAKIQAELNKKPVFMNEYFGNNIYREAYNKLLEEINCQLN